MKITIYTDGSCYPNPAGPGGYAFIINKNNIRTEHSKGYRSTTNNRMELLGVIDGIKECGAGKDDEIVIYSDSQYVCNGIMKGWAKKWKAGKWDKGDKPVKNPDLWNDLLALCDKYKVEFIWIRGHSANVENERCDVLALEARVKYNNSVDFCFEDDTLLDEYYTNGEPKTKEVSLFEMLRS